MLFVNEFASDDDIEKFDLKGIWDKFHPARKGKHFLGERPALTIDRSRNIFLMKIPELAREREEATAQRKLLWWDGIQIVFVVELANGSSFRGSDRPFKRIWNLLSLSIPRGLNVPREDVVEVIKEAVTCCGYLGLYMQIPNTETKVNF